MTKILKYIIIFIVIVILAVVGINCYVIISTEKQIISKNDYSKLSDIDCIIILGAGIWEDKPSPMLEDRLLEGIELYESNVSNKIIMSGDHGKKDYDEVNIMKEYAVKKGIPSESIFMDHAGFSTYESIYRAKEIFEANNVVIVTQKYHLYRALYIANQLGIKAYGVGSDPRQYAGATNREIREILARDKDFFKCIFKPEPKYLGDTIPVSGNGDATNDGKQDFINNNNVDETKDTIYIKINNKVLNVELENNLATKELKELLKNGDIIINAHDYGEFEKVGDLGFSLPKEDTNITTSAGDIVLYQGNQISLFYNSNSWSYTKLGKIKKINNVELKKILGSGDVTLTFTLSQ